MATFTILTRDGKRGPSPPIAPRGVTPAPSEPGVDPGEHLAPPPPKVTLQLFDLAAIAAKGSMRGSRLASIAYWLGIVLGAALAVALIWTPNKAPVRLMDDAPNWSPSTPVKDDNGSGARENFGANPAPAPPQQACGDGAIVPPTETCPAMSGQQPAEPQQPAQALEGPSIDFGARRPQATPSNGAAPANAAAAQPEVRTASGPGARWDGSSNHVRPSEAAPLGITTPVPQ
jgi:hypothetical protein